jgi:hypothetical protein
MRKIRFKSIEHGIRMLTTIILSNTADAPAIAIGPVVWDINPGHDTRCWYFIACSIDANNKLRIERFVCSTSDETEAARAQLMLALAARKPCIIYAFDDELDMAQWCEALAPSERTRKIREGLQRERANS